LKWGPPKRTPDRSSLYNMTFTVSYHLHTMELSWTLYPLHNYMHRMDKRWWCFLTEGAMMYKSVMSLYYELHNWGIRVQFLTQDFSKASRTAMRPTQPPTHSFPWGQSSWPLILLSPTCLHVTALIKHGDK
jgi:hypothetical protein